MPAPPVDAVAGRRPGTRWPPSPLPVAECARAVSTSSPCSDSTPAIRLNSPGRSARPPSVASVSSAEVVHVGAPAIAQRHRVGEQRQVASPRSPPPRTWPTGPRGRRPAGLPGPPRRRAGRHRVGLGERVEQVEHLESPTASATLRIVAGSVRSRARRRRAAAGGAAPGHEHVDVVGGEPDAGADAVHQLHPGLGVVAGRSPCRGRGTARRARAGRAGRTRSVRAAALAAASHRCRSTVKRW